MMSELDPKTEPHIRGSRGGGWSWREEARVCAAEWLGTVLLVLLSCLPGAPLGSGGVVVAMLVQCLDHLSGAMFNPTVTTAALLWGRMGAGRAAGMVCAQLAGAVGGAAALRALLPAASVAAVTQPAHGVSPWVAAALEAAGGACLALANCASWDPRNAHLRDSWPLRIGATVAGLTLVTGKLTGASFNPARSFGPALIAADDGAAWDHHWVYWVGPLSGSVMATSLYIAVWRPRPAPARLPRPLSAR